MKLELISLQLPHCIVHKKRNGSDALQLKISSGKPELKKQLLVIPVHNTSTTTILCKANPITAEQLKNNQCSNSIK